MVRIEDIRVGDRVTLKEGVVTAVRNSAYPISVRTGDETSPSSFMLSSIATHTPKPREFKPGDLVSHFDGGPVYEFISMFGGKAILGRQSAYDRPDVSWANKEDLRHADPAPSPQEEPVKERKKIEYWMNAYPSEAGRGHESRKDADEAATTARIACLHVEGYEGDGL